MRRSSCSRPEHLPVLDRRKGSWIIARLRARPNLERRSTSQTAPREATRDHLFEVRQGEPGPLQVLFGLRRRVAARRCRQAVHRRDASTRRSRSASACRRTRSCASACPRSCCRCSASCCRSGCGCRCSSSLGAGSFRAPRQRHRHLPAMRSRERHRQQVLRLVRLQPLGARRFGTGSLRFGCRSSDAERRGLVPGHADGAPRRRE